MTIDFDYAVIRFVASVPRQEFCNIGVVLHAPAARYLAARFRADTDVWCHGVNASRVARYIASMAAVVDGSPDGGPLAALPRGERFHWLTAPRSDVLQASPRHPGRAHEDDLRAALDRIFEHEVSHGAPDG